MFAAHRRIKLGTDHKPQHKTRNLKSKKSSSSVFKSSCVVDHWASPPAYDQRPYMLLDVIGAQ